MKPHNTKYTQGRANFEVNSFPSELSSLNGLCPMNVVLDSSVGEQVALYWLDRTPFIHELAAVRPFQLYLRSGLYRTDFGPLMWMLFYVPNPIDETLPFASVECHLNPSEPSQVSLWRRLANQTHWHLYFTRP